MLVATKEKIMNATIDRMKTLEILYEHDSDTLVGADLRGRDLRKAAMWSLDLRGVNFRSADLRGAMMAETDLTGADLTLADLRGVNFRSANLTGAIFDGAVVRDADFLGATLPDGTFSVYKSRNLRKLGVPHTEPNDGEPCS